MTIKMIFAHGSNGEFGLNDGLPWDCKEDLAHFKKYTKDCILVMSGATFESLPSLLPGRKHFVLSDREVLTKNGDTPDFRVPKYEYLELLCQYIESYDPRDVCIIGGRDMLLEASLFVEKASVTRMLFSCESTHNIDHELVHSRLSNRLACETSKLSSNAELLTYGEI